VEEHTPKFPPTLRWPSDRVGTDQMGDLHVYVYKSVSQSRQAHSLTS